jgi:hypothetical protein
MNKIRLLRLAVFVVSLSLVFSVSDSTPPLSGNSGDDPVQTVEVSAAPNVLKFHGQNERQYHDMASGSHQLSNGTYLKTVGGEAAILLPDNSAIILDAGTEVRIGMSAQGTYILQRSGTVGHSVEWRQGVNYSVETPFGRVIATGTEFFTFIDTPFEGAVSVVAGTVLWIPIFSVFDPRSGTWDTQYWQKDFVPGNMPMAVYPHDQSLDQVLKWGDYFKLSVDALRNPPYVSGNKITGPPDSSWVQRNRHLLSMINALRRALPVKHLTPAEYRQKLRELLGIDSEGFNPDVPITASGGYWIGQKGGLIIKFCTENNYLDSISYIAPYECADLQTGKDIGHWVDISLGQMVLFPVGAGGSINSVYKIPDGIYKDVVFYIRGTLGGSTGRVWIVIHAVTDVVYCQGISGPINVRRIPVPCPRF